MENQAMEQERYNKARKRVGEIKGFYGNLTSYIVVNCFLMTINLITSPNHLWFYWPLLWWGFGIVFHGLKVFNYMPLFTKEWEERKVKEFMEKEEQTKKSWE